MLFYKFSRKAVLLFSKFIGRGDIRDLDLHLQYRFIALGYKYKYINTFIETYKDMLMFICLSSITLVTSLSLDFKLIGCRMKLIRKVYEIMYMKKVFALRALSNVGC